MSLINWNRPQQQPPGNAPEIASLSGLVDAMWARRQRLAEMEQRRQLEQQQLDEMARHNMSTEGINRDQNEAQALHWQNQIDAENERERQRREAEYRKQQAENSGKVQTQFQSGDIAGAQAAAQRFGGTLAPQSPSLLEVPQVGPYQGGPEDAVSLMNHVASFGAAPMTAEATQNITNHGQQMTAAADAQAENDRRTKEAQGKYVLRLPASNEVFMDSLAEQKARAFRGKQLREEAATEIKALITALPPNEQVFATKAAAQVLSLAPNYDKASDLVKAFTDQFGDYFKADQTRGNAYISAAASLRAAREGRADKPLSDKEREDTAKASRLRGLAEEMYKLPRLSTQGRQIILEHTNDDDFWTRMPAAKALATKLQIYQNIASKLSPQDRAIFQYMTEIGTDLLRKETGAAIQNTEWRNIFDRYLPQPGESPDDDSRKQRFMLSKIDEIAGATRAGYGSGERGGQALTADPARGAPKQNDDDDFLKKIGY